MKARLAIAVLFFAANLAQANWPAWRGPDSNLVAPKGEYPTDFAPGKNMMWEVDLPGEGCSTPTVWGDALFLTSTVDGKDVVLCYGLDGQRRWGEHIGDARGGKHRAASGSNPSCVLDEKHVLAYFKSGTVACFTHDGNKLWSLNLQDKFGKDTLWWDLGSSPVLSSKGAVIAVMQAGDSYLVTLDLASGDVVWKQDRMYDRPKESDQAYTTPQVVNVDGKETIVTWGADHLTGHDAGSGKLLWECGGFNPDKQGMWRVIASATIKDGVAYVPYGRGKYVAAVKLGGSGDVTDSRREWEVAGLGSDVPSPVVDGGKVYILDNGGRVYCVSTKGEELWKDRLPRSGKQYFSSPLLAGGNLYCVREDGAVYVVAAERGLELVGEADLNEEIVASPVPVEGTLLIRTRTKLYRFGKGFRLTTTE